MAEERQEIETPSHTAWLAGREPGSFLKIFVGSGLIIGLIRPCPIISESLKWCTELTIGAL